VASASDGARSTIAALLQLGATASAPSCALREAARGGHVDVVELLLEHAADPNCPPALPAAAAGPHADVVWRLLAAGAKLDQPGDEGKAVPLTLAIKNRQVRGHPAGCALCDGGRRPQAEVVELLFAAGAKLPAELVGTRWSGRSSRRRR
jgi:hypothetical protein